MKRFDIRNSLITARSLRKIGGYTVTFILMACLPAAWAFELQRIEPAGATERLAQFKVLDARPQKEWQKGHLPGAISFSWENYTRTDANGVKYRIFPSEELAGALGEMGISHADAVLIYGDADSSWGGEGWLVWMLAWLGHQGTVYFLDGGIQLWRDSGQPVSMDPATPHGRVAYRIDLQPHLNLTHEQIAAASEKINLVDTRGYLTEWLPGHFPGAIHIPWEKFYKGRYRQPLSPHELEVLLREAGVDLKKPVVYYCSGGIRSGFTWLVHQLSELPSAVNYEGGIEAWGRQHPMIR